MGESPLFHCELHEDGFHISPSILVRIQSPRCLKHMHPLPSATSLQVFRLAMVGGASFPEPPSVSSPFQLMYSFSWWPPLTTQPQPLMLNHDGSQGREEPQDLYAGGPTVRTAILYHYLRPCALSWRDGSPGPSARDDGQPSLNIFVCDLKI